ncbi:RHS repeat-associated core domain-containing protein [uncultured Xanthomonas sp.]|uniref:RHS repeat-associated core domain-containing protein n=1 Tax=uncultured Xanthomonas sp. TaxID=152831 RepID=UPI0025E89D1C|nr:RHS repeat-associated core domain-containing protein [uncultured Xanthomonas sp.]
MSNFQGIRAAVRMMAVAAISLFAASSAFAQTVRYIHTDGLGSIALITDKDRNVVERSEYEPYGSILNRPLSDGVAYTGHVGDAITGLTYMQQRYYDPAIGRFLSSDPVGSQNGANFNRYWYGGNNPYRYIDPDGRLGKDKTNTSEPAIPVANMDTVTVTPPADSSWSWITDRNWFTGDGSITDFDALWHDLYYPLMDTPEGGAVKLAGFAGKGIFLLEGVANFSRELRIADLGIKGTVTELRGVFTVKDGVAIMRIDKLEGKVLNQYRIVDNMVETARATGATSLRIEASYANPRLLDFLARRYNVVSEGATETITISLK